MDADEAHLHPLPDFLLGSYYLNYLKSIPLTIFSCSRLSLCNKDNEQNFFLCLVTVCCMESLSCVVHRENTKRRTTDLLGVFDSYKSGPSKYYQEDTTTTTTTHHHIASTIVISPYFCVFIFVLFFFFFVLLLCAPFLLLYYCRGEQNLLPDHILAIDWCQQLDATINVRHKSPLYGNSAEKVQKNSRETSKRLYLK